LPDLPGQSVFPATRAKQEDLDWFHRREDKGSMWQCGNAVMEESIYSRHQN
jgi:hypothetical protein